VTVFNDAREALEKLRSGESYDLVLCDLMMPRMTGMEFFNELSASSPDILSKVIFLTAGAFTPGARAFLESVSNRRLDKPFDAQTLRSTVNSFLR
jgi:CheY-like chemotaxis protein